MKAMIIFDINEHTYEAINEYFTSEITLHLGNEGYFDFKDAILQPMPQRKMVGKIKEVDDFMKSEIEIINEEVTARMMLDTELLIASGYNLCIDEILGGE